MVSSSRKARFSLPPPLRSVVVHASGGEGEVHQPVHAAARTTVRVWFFSFCDFVPHTTVEHSLTRYLCLVPLELSLQVSARLGSFGGAGRTCRTYQGQRDGGCEQIANAHTTKKVRDVGAEHGMTNCTHTRLGVLHLCSNNTLHREGEGAMNEVPQKVGPHTQGTLV
jgi:hypothetical protein